MAEEEKEQRQRTRLSDFPWKPFVAGLAGIGGAHLLGHATASTLGHTVAHSPTAQKILRTPASRERFRRALPFLISGAGSLGSVAAFGATVAQQERLQRAFDERRKKLEEQQSAKVASVILVYKYALESMR